MEKTSLEKIYEDAKHCPVKGRLYMYEQYKRQLQSVELSNEEYTEACRRLANYLEV